MHVIARPAIQQAIERHPDAAGWLGKWWQNACKERWESLHDVRALYPAADQVDCCLVFNACGNNYRLVVVVRYRFKKIFVHKVMTHREYDDWNKLYRKGKG